MKQKSPLKNGLYVRNPLSNFFLRFFNWVLFWKKHANPIPENPQKILLCNIANFGDVVVSTTVLPVIKKKYPSCEIGFLTSSASAVVLKNHPLVSHIHTFDHWYLSPNKCKAALRHFKRKRWVVQQLKEQEYELAIDLYSYFPNAIPLLEKAKIPVRIGYSTGGFSHLLTHSIPWEYQNHYVGYAHLQLLKTLEIDVSKESPLPHYHFYNKNKSASIVIHMGCSNPMKEWNKDCWIALIKKLYKHYPILLTGKGKHEMELCHLVAKETSVKNLSDQLSWEEFVKVIQEAKLLISVDSVALHIAAASLTPTIGLFAGIAPPMMWTPPFSKFTRIMNKVPCSPCLKKRGCSTLSCIRGIKVEEVFNTAMDLLDSLQS